MAACGNQASSATDAGARDAAVEIDGSLVDLSGTPTDTASQPIDLASADLSPRLVEGKVVDDLDAPVVGFKVAIGAAMAMTPPPVSFR